MILRGHPSPRIDHENDDIGLRYRLLGLLRHFPVNTTGSIGLETPCINDDIFVFTLLAIAIMPVACKTGKICHDSIPRFCQAIEKRRFADIGAPYQGDHW